jgi:hypothetical protein
MLFPVLNEIHGMLCLVRSFGTEDRKDPAESIPASQNVYEYIVFRGADIKDLQVMNAPVIPPMQMPPQVPNDPAILQVSKSYTEKEGIGSWGL